MNLFFFRVELHFSAFKQYRKVNSDGGGGEKTHNVFDMIKKIRCLYYRVFVDI